MRDSEPLGEGVASRIVRRLPKRWQAAFGVDRGTDIEKLISLLAASGVAVHHSLAETLRRFYFKDICKQLAAAKVLRKPQLAIGLLQMHSNEHFRNRVEELTGLITTNHDGLLQVAAQAVFEGVNIGIPFSSKDLLQDVDRCAPILQLHGSFTWTFDLPLKVTLLRTASTYSNKTVWLPPTILKESKNYPFNKLAGLAYDLLARRCDVLRVVGASLTQNDWNVLSMIFHAQRHRELTRGSAFRIELIMPNEAGLGILDSCSYLKYLFPISRLTEGDFSAYGGVDETPLTEEMRNPLAYWMKQKIRFHQNQGDFGSTPIDESMARIEGDAA